jgi:small subunit ribosomal protein S19
VGRSLKKGPFVDPRVWERVERMNATGRKEPLKTWARRCDVVPEFVGHTFLVHNGNRFVKVYVTEDMVGHKLGEFAPTRLFRAHSTRKPETEGEAAAAAAPKK